MSTTIDDRVVALEFNNKHFERNVSDSLALLEKLEESLNFSDSGKELLKLKDVLDSVNIDNISSGVEALQKRFSTFGIIGMRVLENITDKALELGKGLWDKTIGQIMTGGKTRALNLEQARYTLNSILKDGTRVENVMSDVNDAVTGTAYSLDQAAMAAASLTSSGILSSAEGGSMKMVLKGIAGVAATTGAEFNQISDIFTVVAGNGRMMNMEIRRLNQHGMNAAATIKDYFNGVQAGSIDATDAVKRYVAEVTNGRAVTEADIREMASHGEISYTIFTNAMYSAYGDAAAKANETYKGALSNLKAALSRIGADFATPFLVYSRNVFNALRLLVNDVRTALQPLVSAVVGFMDTNASRIVNFINGFRQFKVYEPIVAGVFNIFKAGLSVIDAIGRAFRNVFHGFFIENLKTVAEGFERLTSKLILSEKSGAVLEKIFTGLFYVLKALGIVLNVVFTILFKVIGVIGKVVGAVANFIGMIKELIVSSRVFQKISESIKNAFSKLSVIFDDVRTTLTNAFENSGPLIEDLKQRTVRAFEVIKEGINAVIPIVGKYFSAFEEGIKAKVPEILSRISGSFKDFVSLIKQYGPEIFSSIISGIKDFILIVSRGLPVIVNTILYNLSAILNIINAYVTPIGNTIFDILIGAIGVVEQRAPELIHALVGAIKSIVKAAFTEAALVIYTLGSTIFGAIKEFFTGTAAEAEKGTAGVAKSAITLGGILTGVKNAISKTFHAIVDILKPIFEKIKHFLGDITLLDILNTASFATIAFSFKKISGSLGDTINTFGAIGKALKDKILDPLGQIQKDIKPQYIFALAAAIAALAISIKLIASVDPVGVAVGMSAISLFLFEMHKFMSSMANVKFETGALVKNIVAIMAISVSMKMLASAVRQMAEVTPESGLVAFASIMGFLYGLSDAMKRLVAVKFDSTVGGKRLIAISIALIALGSASILLSKAMSQLASLSGDQIGLGIAAVTVAIATLVAGINRIDKEANVLGAGAVLKAFALSLLGFALAMKILGSFAENTEALKMAAGLVIGFMVAVATFVNLLPQKMEFAGVAGTLIAFGVAINLLVAPIIALSLLPWEKLGQGFLFVGMTILGLFAAIKLMGKVEISGAAASLIALGIAMNLLVAPIIALSMVPAKKLAAGVLAVVFSLSALAGMITILSIAAKNMTFGNMIGLLSMTVAMMAMARAITLLTIPIAVLGQMKFGAILKGIGAILLIILSLSAASVVLGAVAPLMIFAAVAVAAFGAAIIMLGKGLGYAVSGMLAFASMGLTAITTISAMIVSLSAAIGLAVINLSKALGQAIGEFLGNAGESIRRNKYKIVTLIRDIVDIIGVALTDSIPKLAVFLIESLVTLLDKAIEYAPILINKVVDFILSVINSVKDRIPEIVAAVVDLFDTLMGEISKYDPPSLENLVLSITGIAAVIAILGNLPIKAAGIAVANLGIFVAGLVLILAALGQLSEIEGTKEALEKSIEIVGLIGQAIGTFIGSIGIGLTSDLGQIADNLTAFSDKIGSFLSVMSDVGRDTTLLIGVSTIVDAITQFTKVNNKSIDAGSLVEFTDNLSQMAPGLKDFSDSIKDVNITSISTAAEAIKILSDVTKELPNSGGAAGFFAGNNDPDEWAAQLQGLCRGINNFALNTKGKDYSGVQPAAEAVSTLAAAAKTIGNEGGWLGQIVGENDPQLWGQKIPSLGAGIASFAMKVGNKDFSGVQPAAEAISDLSFAAKDIPNTGGAAGFFAGENDVDVWGNKLPALGEGIAAFADSVEGMSGKIDSIHAAVGAISALAGVSKEIGDSGGTWANFYNVRDIQSFGTNLPVLGTAISEYGEAVNGLPVFAVASSVDALVALLNGITAAGGSIPNSDNLATLGGNLEAFAPGFSAYGAVVSEMDFSNMGLSVQTLTNVAKGLSGIVIPTGEGLTTLGDQLAIFGPSMAEFGNSLIGVEFGSAESAISTAKSAARMIEGMNLSSTVSVTAFKAAIAELATTDYQGMVDAFEAGSIDVVGIITGMLNDSEVAIAGFTGRFKTAAQNLMDNFKTGIESRQQAIKNAISNILSAARSSVGSQSGSFQAAGANAALGFINGLNSRMGAVRLTAAAIGTEALNALKNSLNIKSPSRAMRELGDYTIQGFVLGLTDDIDDVAKIGSELAEMTMFALSHALDLIDSSGELTPTITPVLDLTNIQNGIGYMHSMLANGSSYQLASTTGRISSPNSAPLNGLMGRLGRMSNADVVQELSNLRTDVQTLNENMAKMQVVMDTGALVGSLASPLDAKLGRMAVYKGRGI